MSKNPIICAIDTVDIEDAKSLITKIKPFVGAVKLGLEFFTANGAEGVKAIEKLDMPIFLDLKFHDIPNTVAKAVKATAALNVFMMTIHASGGADMMRAAADAALEAAATNGNQRPSIIGVTVLTSMDESDLRETGINHSPAGQAQKLAALAQKSGLDGIVCSPHEASTLRQQCRGTFTLVTPGIRPAGSTKGDQKRISSPKEAINAGSTYLVIGRPITKAPSPAAAAKEILDSLA